MKLHIIYNTLTKERCFTTCEARVTDLREEEVIEASYEVTGGYIAKQNRHLVALGSVAQNPSK